MIMSSSTSQERSLIIAYQKGTLTDVTYEEVVTLIKSLIHQNITIHKQDKTIKRLNENLDDLVRVRNSLKHWHKIHDETMRLRKQVQELEYQVKKCNEL